MARGKSKADSRTADSNLGVRKRQQKRGMKAKDPNKPKKPPSAFLVFMEEFRKQFKEENPDNKSVAVVAKAGGQKWKSLSDEQKAPHVNNADKRKQDYERQMQAYNKKLEGGQDEESDKSNSEVNDEDQDDGSNEEGEED